MEASGLSSSDGIVYALVSGGVKRRIYPRRIAAGSMGTGNDIISGAMKIRNEGRGSKKQVDTKIG